MLLKVAVEVAMNPVPLMVSVCAVTPAVRVAGDREVTVGIGLPAETVTVVEPDLVGSSVDVAVMVAVPVAEDVNTPAVVVVPSVANQVTPEL
jgi:hypothetical protein